MSRKLFIIAILALLVGGGGFYLANLQQKPVVQQVAQQQIGQQQNSPNPTSTQDNGVIAQARQYLIGRVGSNIFNTEFQYSWMEKVHPGNSSLYVVEYLFSPKSDPGESFPIDINVYYGANIIAYVPNCLADPSKCQIQISRQMALQIAQKNWPEPWAAMFDYNYTQGPLFDTFYWSLNATSTIPGCTGVSQQSMSINPVSGSIEATSSECFHYLYP